MIRSKADNAVLAKVHALYGQRIKESDFTKLASCPDLAAVTSYLKNDTYYKESLLEVNEETVHRGQLESLLHKRVLGICLDLIRFSPEDHIFLTFYTRTNEIQQILIVLRYLSSGEMDRYINSMPLYFNRYMCFDLQEMSQIHSFHDLLSVLQKTPYYNVLLKHRPQSSESIEVPACERDLLAFFYSQLFATIDKNYRGAVKNQLLSIFSFQLDYHNISIIYRLKYFFHYSPQQILPLIVPGKTSLSKALYGRLMEAEDVTSFFQILEQKSSLSREFLEHTPNELPHITHQLSKMRKYSAKKFFSFSHYPAVATISYLTLLETEVSNLIHIIEGIRYHVPPSEIQSSLTI